MQSEAGDGFIRNSKQSTHEKQRKKGRFTESGKKKQFCNSQRENPQFVEDKYPKPTPGDLKRKTISQTINMKWKLTTAELKPCFQLCYSSVFYLCRRWNHKAPLQLFPLQIWIILSSLSVALDRNQSIMPVWHLFVGDLAWQVSSATVISFLMGRDWNTPTKDPKGLILRLGLSVQSVSFWWFQSCFPRCN